MNWKEFIIADPDILVGKPVIKGTRISVEYIISMFAQGWDEQKILANHPRLTKENLQAVFAYVQYCLQDGLLCYPIQKRA